MSERELFNLILMVLVAILMLNIAHILYYILIRNRWQTINGKIIANETRSRRFRYRWKYQVRVKYKYTVEGVVYVGRRIAISDYVNLGLTWFNEDHAQYLQKEFKQNRRIKVHYYPQKPSVAVLDTTIIDFNTVVLIVFYILGAIVLLFMAYPR